ncbi:MAG: cation:proton antiporter [Nannocystaceae bacterium]
MDASVTVFLITIASLLMVGAIGELVFVRTRIPDALWLISVGVFLRISGIVDASTLHAITPYFAAMTLIIVLFDGGSRLRVGDLAKAAGRGAILAVATFFFTMIVVALFSQGLAALGLLSPWSWIHGLMLGAIVGGSSSLILMPSLALSRAPERIANLINIESALTDALCVVFTLAFIDVLISGNASAGDAALTLLKNFGIAGGLGALLGWGFIPVMRALEGSTYAYPFTLAGLMLLYVLVDGAGGSPAMGVLAFAIVVGNAAPFTKWLHRLGPEDPGIRLDARVQEVHAQISFIFKSLFFTFLGLMLSPPWGLLIMGGVLGLVLLLARLPAVFVAVRGAGLSDQEVDVAYVCLPRGMAAGALATMPHLAGVPGTAEVPTLVFSAVIASIVIFSVGFRRVSGPVGAIEGAGPKGQVAKDRSEGTGGEGEGGTGGGTAGAGSPAPARVDAAAPAPALAAAEALAGGTGPNGLAGGSAPASVDALPPPGLSPAPAGVAEPAIVGVPPPVDAPPAPFSPELARAPSPTPVDASSPYSPGIAPVTPVPERTPAPVDAPPAPATPAPEPNRGPVDDDRRRRAYAPRSGP